MADSHPLDRLFATIAARRAEGDATRSYTAHLLAAGVGKCAQKFGEEAVETVIAATSQDAAALTAESADLLYHLLVLWAARGVEPQNVYDTLARRESQSGLQEKAARPQE